ncbi:MAG: metalloregulator ArsR/SmtB family transcription factor [Proteobacteria bacterium]|nr:metalloregulator ArsR/SmtB family transcription factor [Pseudomonadota bacterium]MBU1639257.1 metalloregulator ArsR/SmtB family transcription factor [Pseudomonadota bacterium]
MKEFIKIMKALSDPNRVTIIKLLEEKELCVCEFQALLGLAQSTVSKHLKLLEDAGLVSSRRQGSWIIFKLLRGGGSVYSGAMLELMPGWLNSEREIQNLKLRLKDVDRLRLCSA